ncbi:hypothetical protein VW29_01460 [Devosia limi DSM 17137]|uniref:Uncharacterized protein n=1 Tax=Devosia limi DSM 17137 TaxID=1121477 RepID=A0A0F5LY94_9HYPH|nr:hypothetical protein [Devosia limi]KKB86602.1 hypothetical protein VW29_01460 [Devosia limi DSM 17137]SHF65854.1 hypothetical protein SAMN02745223_03218 [Devosia limi DSM 17137]
MIPASYLFKNVYRQTWIDPQPGAPVAHAQRHRPARTTAWLSTLVHRLPHLDRHQAGCPDR